MGAGGSLPLAHHLFRDLRGHVEVEHKIRLRQTYQAVLRVKEPTEEVLPFAGQQLGGLVHGVGGGVAVRHHKAPGLVEGAPVLLVGGVAVHGVKEGGGVGVDIPGVLTQVPVQVLLYHGRRGLAVAGEIDVLVGDALPGQALTEELGLGGLAGTVRPLEDDEFSLHFPHFSFRTCTRKSGSFIIRPMRLGSLQRR